MNDTERLHSRENFPPRHGDARGISPEARVSLEDAEETFTQRSLMLASIEADIAPALQDALRAKLDYERTFLRMIAESDAREGEAARRSRGSLDHEYFALQPLETDRF